MPCFPVTFVKNSQLEYTIIISAKTLKSDHYDADKTKRSDPEYC